MSTLTRKCCYRLFHNEDAVKQKWKCVLKAHRDRKPCSGIELVKVSRRFNLEMTPKPPQEETETQIGRGQRAFLLLRITPGINKK